MNFVVRDTFEKQLLDASTPSKDAHSPAPYVIDWSGLGEYVLVDADRSVHIVVDRDIEFILGGIATDADFQTFVVR